MFAWRRKERSEGDTGEGRSLAYFTYGVLALGFAIFGIDSLITARAMQPDPFGYPVRLIIPEPIVEIARRPPPVLLGENVALVKAALAEKGDPGLRPLRSEAGAFERAFGEAPQRTARAAQFAPPPAPGRSGMLDIDFNLKGGAQSPRTITVRKPVAIAGAASGNLSLRIDGAARIYANKAEVATLLEGRSDKSERIRTASGEEFVSFDQLRDLGVNIRYDPSADRIVIPADS